MSARDRITQQITQSIETTKRVLEGMTQNIADAAEACVAAINSGNKILFFGNGGSASDAQHLAAEFVGRYDRDRRPLAAIALTTDTSILTSVANDYNFDIIFARQIEALGKQGDVAIGLSTSGNSPNVLSGIRKARDMGLNTIVFSGRDGGALKGEAKIELTVPSQTTARIQEAHIMIGHILCSAVDDKIIGENE